MPRLSFDFRAAAVAPPKIASRFMLAARPVSRFMAATPKRLRALFRARHFARLWRGR